MENSDRIRLLIDKRNQAIEEGRRIVEEAGDNPVLSAEADESFQRAMSDERVYREAIQKEQDLAVAEASVSEERARYQTAPAVPADQAQVQRDAARAFMKGETQTLTVPIGAPEYRTDMTTIDTTIYGKYTFANPVWQTVEMHMNAQSGLLKANPSIIRTPGFEIMYIPNLTTDAAASAHAEGAAATVSDPVLGRTTLGAQRYDGFFAVADEMLASSDINFASLLGDLAGRAIATSVAAGLAAGAGTGTLPQGVFGKTTTTTTLGVTAAAVGTFTFDELISLKLSVLPGYRMSPSCAWLFSTTAYVILAKMKDDEGRYLWSPSTVGNEPDRLLGNPCYEEASGETVATANHPIVYGDFSHYWVRYSGPGMVFDRDPSVAFTHFEQTFRYAIWVDGDLGQTDAIKHMIMA